MNHEFNFHHKWKSTIKVYVLIIFPTVNNIKEVIAVTYTVASYIGEQIKYIKQIISENTSQDL